MCSPSAAPTTALLTGMRASGYRILAYKEGPRVTLLSRNDKEKTAAFANVAREEIEAIYRLAKLPPHPLVASGYLSVGCMPCSSRTAPGEDARAGRWRGKAKTECGIHTTKTS